jgi:hypothetical protein
MAKPKKKKAKKASRPSLKSTSGAGFAFEDKVAAHLLCEMLAAQPSLGGGFSIIERLERQAGDWEPFGDLLLTGRNASGKPSKCGGSVKSNRQINSNGCDNALCERAWTTIGKPTFASGEDSIALFCATLSANVSGQVNTLCQQARELEPTRLDEKVIHRAQRKIYDSFRNPNVQGDAGLPGHVLGRLILREFDFEKTASRDEAEALRLCREILRPHVAG